MLFNTRHFGEIEINEDKIISFEEGIPGFNNVRKFVILDTYTTNDNRYDNMNNQNNSVSPFKWLQCVDEPMLAFAIVNPFLLKPDYDIELSNEVIEQLGIKNEEDVAVYAIVVVPEDISKMTMNLKAPLIINLKSKKGMQTILDTEKYSVRHYIMDEKAGQEVKANACADKKKGSVNCNR
ncbi:MAG TPA: flagellar assembly protein FliW [Clostridiales bacterium]|nr:flagellar assembly protein FliW [Clostridiales bacterium]